jgi:hypothetical protein
MISGSAQLLRTADLCASIGLIPQWASIYSLVETTTAQSRVRGRHLRDALDALNSYSSHGLRSTSVVLGK